jgi:CubicO group peptidase (beta-lactamase class C family)
VLAAGSTLRFTMQAESERAAVQPPPPWFVTRLSRLLEISGTPGCAVVVLQRGRVVWEHYAGLMNAADEAPVTRDTMWPAASLGKPVFAAAALTLVSEGKLDLDKPLREYVADHAAADERTSKITARHVLSHTSGLPNWRTRDQPLVSDFEPGSRFSYSGEGYYYLQTVIERITGLGIQQVVNRAVFEPLGMKSSTYTWRDDVPSRLVAGHDRGVVRPNNIREFSTKLLAYAAAQGKSLDTFTSAEARQAMAAIPEAPLALPVFMVPNVAGSLITTPRDYAAFLAAVLDPSTTALKIAKPVREAMTTPQVSLNSALGWGLGWGLETHANTTATLWHWGDNGNWKNFVLVEPRDRSAIVAFTNSTHGMNVAQRLIAAATGEDHVAFQWL